MPKEKHDLLVLQTVTSMRPLRGCVLAAAAAPARHAAVALPAEAPGRSRSVRDPKGFSS